MKEPFGQEKHGRLYMMSRAHFFDGDAAGVTSICLDFCLKFRFATLMVFFATIALTASPVHDHPEGLLPEPGYGPDHRSPRRGRRTSPSRT